jgi:hypothetical protein
MPFNRENIKSKFYNNEQYYSFDEITINLNQVNRDYEAFAVHKIYDTNIINFNDISSVLGMSQYAVLTKQENRKDNGLYRKISSTGVSRQANPDKDTFYLGVSRDLKKAVYISETEDFLEVYFNRVLLGTSIGTSTGTSTVTNKLLNFPVPYNRPLLVKTNINAVKDDKLFNGEYKIIYYNKDGTSITTLDNFSEITNRSHPSSFNLPIISFTTDIGSSSGSLNLVANNTGEVEWYIKSEMFI